MDTETRGDDDNDASNDTSSTLSSIKKKLNRSASDASNSKDGFIFGSWKSRRKTRDDSRESLQAKMTTTTTTSLDARYRDNNEENREDEYATVDYGSMAPTTTPVQAAAAAAVAAPQVRRRIKPNRPSSVHDQLREQDFWCPRCGSKMEEPRLLPCLHSVCSACVNEFMSKDYYGEDDADDDKNGPEQHLYSRLQQPNRTSGSSSSARGLQLRRVEGCPCCDHPLPRHGSAQPPPHYSLQHRLVIYAVRRRLSQRAICCDACPQEVQATQHCSCCLCNFCDECGAAHEHRVRPLWQAKRIRRLAVCLEHPAHSLRYHCLACKRATCKECMWTDAHRGHASEDAAQAGARARLQLEAALVKARGLLELLLRETERRSRTALDFLLKDGWQRTATTTTTTTTSPQQSHSRGHARSRSSVSTHSREARQRILEYSRLKRAKYLIDAIFIADDLLANGSVVEILSLKRIILKRLKFLGLDVDDSNAPDGCDRATTAAVTTPTSATSETTMHSGIFHCCTFCSSGGKKDVTCACGGTMPGGYRGCGHGHSGHPGERHWSCCGSTQRNSICRLPRRCTYKLII